ncbi:YdeI/OmpD-associated family protein [Pseudarthrobacter sp. N5]|uniref:YdeI/OmpD-associated family protein n=1 Tax=Pseudarthrobacter sp. N5 TaxID=3418416 RepID=UPI003CF289C0
MRYVTGDEQLPWGGLSRPAQPMSQAVREALEQADLFAEYDARPAYQRNDYLAWIQRGQRPETRLRRLGQMIVEVAHGGTYMGMRHNPSHRDT